MHRPIEYVGLSGLKIEVFGGGYAGKVIKGGIPIYVGRLRGVRKFDRVGRWIKSTCFMVKIAFQG